MTPSREETQAFFAERAARWDSRFPDDGPRYEAAIATMGLAPGEAVLDLGCGTGRATPFLRAAVGPTGRVVAADLTIEMLDVLASSGRRAAAAPVLADGSGLPFPPASFDAVFAAGVLEHVAEPVAVLTELARVMRPRGRLALFHLKGRPDPTVPYGDIRDEAPLRAALGASGWGLRSLDDGTDHYLARAELE